MQLNATNIKSEFRVKSSGGVNLILYLNTLSLIIPINYDKRPRRKVILSECTQQGSRFVSEANRGDSTAINYIRKFTRFDCLHHLASSWSLSSSLSASNSHPLWSVGLSQSLFLGYPPTTGFFDVKCHWDFNLNETRKIVPEGQVLHNKSMSSISHRIHRVSLKVIIRIYLVQISNAFLIQRFEFNVSIPCSELYS